MPRLEYAFLPRLHIQWVWLFVSARNYRSARAREYHVCLLWYYKHPYFNSIVYGSSIRIATGFNRVGLQMSNSATLEHV